MAQTAQITVRFEPEDMARIKELAKRETRPPANFITWVVLQYIRNVKHLEEQAQDNL